LVALDGEGVSESCAPEHSFTAIGIAGLDEHASPDKFGAMELETDTEGLFGEFNGSGFGDFSGFGLSFSGVFGLEPLVKDSENSQDNGKDDGQDKAGEDGLSAGPHIDAFEGADGSSGNGFSFEPVFEILGQSRSGSVALINGFLEAFQTNGGKVMGDLRIKGFGSARFQASDHGYGSQGGIAFKGWLAGQAVIENGTQPPDISGGGQGGTFALGLFGGHITGGPHDGPIHGEGVGITIFGDDFGETEVGNMGLALGIDEDVTGFEVAVENAALVGVGKGASHFGDNLGGLSGVFDEAFRQSS
jgi:hypothetical protein